jgi:hypothetical protein
MQLEKTILTNLLRNEDYTRKVLPFIKSEYFSAEEDRILYTEINNFILKYNRIPDRVAIAIEINNLRNIKEDQVKSIAAFLESLRNVPDTNQQWLIDSTERFCQDKALYHAIMKSIELLPYRLILMLVMTICKTLKTDMSIIISFRKRCRLILSSLTRSRRVVCQRRH